MDTPIPDHSTRRNQAEEVTSEMYGTVWKQVIEGIRDIDKDFAAFVEEIPYGSVFPRDTLTLQQRQIASITALTQLNLKPQLKSHLIAALRVGLKKEEIAEILIHISMFIGFPLVLDAFRVYKEVLDSWEKKE